MRDLGPSKSFTAVAVAISLDEHATNAAKGSRATSSCR
jgi:hypothetical protein